MRRDRALATDEGETDLLGEVTGVGDCGELALQAVPTEVYGGLGPEGAFSESSPLSPNSPYAASKASSDLLVLSYAHTHGLPAVVTRATFLEACRHLPTPIATCVWTTCANFKHEAPSDQVALLLDPAALWVHLCLVHVAAADVVLAALVQVRLVPREPTHLPLMARKMSQQRPRMPSGKHTPHFVLL